MLLHVMSCPSLFPLPGCCSFCLKHIICFCKNWNFSCFEASFVNKRAIIFLGLLKTHNINKNWTKEFCEVRMDESQNRDVLCLLVCSSRAPWGSGQLRLKQQGAHWSNSWPLQSPCWSVIEQEPPIPAPRAASLVHNRLILMSMWDVG